MPPTSISYNAVPQVLRISLQQNTLKKGRFLPAPRSALGAGGRLFESIAGPPAWIRNRRRESCKTVFLGSQDFTFERLEQLADSIRARAFPFNRVPRPRMV